MKACLSLSPWAAFFVRPQMRSLEVSHHYKFKVTFTRTQLRANSEEVSIHVIRVFTWLHE